MGVLALSCEARRDWLHAERFINDGSPNRRSFSNGPEAAVSPRFAAIPTFLPCLPMRDYAHGALGNYLIAAHDGTPAVPVHPSVGPYLADRALKNFVTPDMRLEATPLASGRTFATNLGWSVKLSYPGILGRFAATLDDEKALFALDVDAALASSLTAQWNANQPEIAWFRERSAGWIDVFRDRRIQGLATCIIRDESATTTGQSGTLTRLLPMFSLWSDSQFDGCTDVPLIFDVLGKGRSARTTLSNDEITGIAWQVLVRPILESTLYLSTELGLLPEPHAQNLLLGQVQEGMSTRWVLIWRDLLGFYVDTDWRKHLGLPVDDTMSRRTLTDPTTAWRVRSAALDHMLYDYILAPLLRSCRLAGASDLDLLRAIRSMVTEWCGRKEYYLPPGGWFERSLEPPLPGERLAERNRPGPSMIRDLPMTEIGPLT